MPKVVKPERRRDLTEYMSEKSQSNLFLTQQTMVIAEMHLVQQIPQIAIAEKLGLSQGYVSTIIKKAREEYKMKTAIHVRHDLNVELQKLNVIEREAWQSWFKSVGKTTKVVKRTDGNGDIIDATETVEDKNGDPRFMTIIHSCMDKRHKLLGLNQPQELIVHNAESKLTRYISEGKITFDALVDEFGREQAVKYFNLAGATVPDIVDGEIIAEENSDVNEKLIGLIQSGNVTFETLKVEVGKEKAVDYFEQAGVNIHEVEED